MKWSQSVEVKLWGEIVGHIALTSTGVPKFEYAKNFIKTGWEISPIDLPLSTTTIYTQRSRASTFRGIPGVFADCLPDRFGRRVISDFYKIHYGLIEQEVDVIKMLLYVGDRAIGALEFSPSFSHDDEIAQEQYLGIGELRQEAKNTLEGKANIVTAKMMKIGGSAGGAQAKALIDFNPSTMQMKSGFAEASAGFVPCMIKFDGVREGEEEGCYGRLEYVYSEMARLCDLKMPRTYLLEDENRAHFIVERFDRNHAKEKKHHFASLCGLTTKDYYQKYSCSYEEYFQVVSLLTNDASKVLEAFKLAVFNIIFRNQDDHTKNFGFLMDQEGKWDLSPVYDLNYVYDGASAQTHQMKFNNKDDAFLYKDFIQVGTSFGLKKNQIEEILTKTIDVSSQFLDLCNNAKLDEAFSEGVCRNFRKIKI